MNRASRVTGRVWRLWVALSLILGMLPFFLPSVGADFSRTTQSNFGKSSHSLTTSASFPSEIPTTNRDDDLVTFAAFPLAVQGTASVTFTTHLPLVFKTGMATTDTPEPADIELVPVFTLTKVAEPSPVLTSFPLEYTLTLTNTGTASTTSTIVTDVIPLNTDFIAATTAGVIFEGPDANDVITWTLPFTIDVGQSSFVTFTVQTPNVAGTVVNESYGITATDVITPTVVETVTTAVLPGIVINEIMQNPSAVADSAGEWFELYNPTDAPVDINGWTMQDNDIDSHVIDNGGPLLIGPSEYLVLGNNGDVATNGGAEVDYEYPGDWYLANGADEVVLLDGDLNEIDRVEYDGGPEFPHPTGASMALMDPALDNNIGANWYEEEDVQYGDGDYGTPGWENGTFLPDTEPPQVVSTDPGNDETNVAVYSDVSATFDEAINEITLSFTLAGPSGPVAGSVSYEAGTYTATFDPDAPLDYETTFTATIAAGLEDMSGNATTEAYVWSFTTAQEVPLPTIVINEIMQDPSAVGDSDGEWFELYNAGAVAVDINGWTMQDNDSDSHVIDNGDPLLIGPGEYLVLGNNGDVATNGGAEVDYEYPGNWYLANGADEVVLLDGDLNEIDRVEYDGGTEFPDPTGASIALKNPTLDNSVGGNWEAEDDIQYGDGDFGTPGWENGTPPPSEVTPIGEARLLLDDTAVTVEGIATAPTDIYYAGGGNTKFYIQDSTGGAQIQVFGSNGPLPEVTLGDRVRVSGVTGHYRNEFQIVPQNNTADILITDGEPGDVPPPLEVAIADVGEDTEGWLIAFEGLVVDAWDSGFGFNARLSDGLGHETRIYVDDMTGIDVTGIVVGLVQRFVGISAQYDDHYETRPRIQEDVPEWPNQQGPCPAAAETAPGPLVISAAHYDTTYLGYDELAEAVQVMNTGGAAVSLAGLYLSDNEAQVALPDLWLDPGQKVWLARDEARFTLEFGFAPAWTYGDLAPDLLFDNAGDEALLLDAAGAVVDALVIENGCAVEQSGWSDSTGVFPYLFASYVSADGQIFYRKLDEATGWPVPDTDMLADWAQDPNDGVLGRKMLYPGWDLDQFFFPPKIEEEATTTLLVAPDNMYDNIAALIAEAQTDIDIEIYLFSHPLLADELIQAMDRGVHVRLLLEGEVYGAPGGTWDGVRWVAKQVYDHPNGEVYFWRDGLDDEGLALADRYNNVHQKFIIVDGVKAAILSENFRQSSMPHDDKADGTSGHRGAGIITTAPTVIAHLRAVFDADLDLSNHRDVDPFTPGRDDVRYEEGHEGEPLVREEEQGNSTGYMPVRPEPLTLDDVVAFEVVQSPDTSLRTTDALLGMVARADSAGDLVLVQQQYEHQYWGPYSAQYLNPRLSAYIEAAQLGATVRIMVANDDDNTYEDELIQFLNDLATSEGLNLAAGKGTPTAGWLNGEPNGGHIHSKMVLVYDGDTQGWVHVGSINGSENSSRYNREMALQIGSNEAFNYYAGVFHADWVASDLPAFLGAPVASFEASTYFPQVGETVFFSNTTTGSLPILFEWDFGDGSPVSTEVHPSHVYDAPGTYEVTLHAVNAVGESFATAEIRVGYAPVAAFSAHPTMPLPGEEVQFTNESTGSEPLTFLWDLGDGETSEEVNPAHAYADPGVYIVTLTARNPWGEDTATGAITVYQPLTQFTLHHMIIHWHRHDSIADFVLDGKLELPPSYSHHSLTGQVIMAINIDGKTVWQKARLDTHGHLWLLDETGAGKGLNMERMTICWLPYQRKEVGMFGAVGQFEMPGVSADTRPPQATVTLRLLAEPDSLPVYGQELVDFQVFRDWWLFFGRH